MWNCSLCWVIGVLVWKRQYAAHSIINNKFVKQIISYSLLRVYIYIFIFIWTEKGNLHKSRLQLFFILLCRANGCLKKLQRKKKIFWIGKIKRMFDKKKETSKQYRLNIFISMILILILLNVLSRHIQVEGWTIWQNHVPHILPFSFIYRKKIPITIRGKCQLTQAYLLSTFGITLILLCRNFYLLYRHFSIK